MTLSVRKPDFKRIIPKVEPKKRTRLCALKSCRKPFLKQSSWHIACSTDCAIAVVAEKREKADRKDRQKRLTALKTRSDHLKLTQVAVNALVRWRDRNDGCISCDKPATWDGQWHASHFKSVGSSPALRFDLNNIHKACSVCNNWLSGNIGPYRARLIIKIGQSEVDRLEGPQEPRKWSIDELAAIRSEYKLKMKEIKNGKE